jgi:hypothetical protein
MRGEKSRPVSSPSRKSARLATAISICTRGFVIDSNNSGDFSLEACKSASLKHKENQLVGTFTRSAFSLKRSPNMLPFFRN